MRRRAAAPGLLAAALLGIVRPARGDLPAEPPASRSPAPRAGVAAHPDLTEVELELAADVGPRTSREWLGLTDGTSIGASVALRGAVNARRGSHALHGALGAAAGLGFLAAAEDVGKIRDELSLEGGYLYALTGWFGPLARVTVDTTMFGGSDVREGPTLRKVERRDGRVETLLTARLPVTDPLRPLTFGQSLGPLLRPVASRPIAVFLHAGAGARETIAEGQLAGADRAATPAQELEELGDVAQVGADGGLAIRGTIEDVGVRYAARAQVLIPFAHTSSRFDGGEGLTTAMAIDVASEIGIRLPRGASLDYGFRALREPLVVDAFQFQSGLRLTVVIRLDHGEEEAALAFP